MWSFAFLFVRECGVLVLVSVWCARCKHESVSGYMHMRKQGQRAARASTCSKRGAVTPKPKAGGGRRSCSSTESKLTCYKGDAKAHVWPLRTFRSRAEWEPLRWTKCSTRRGRNPAAREIEAQKSRGGRELEALSKGTQGNLTYCFLRDEVVTTLSFFFALQKNCSGTVPSIMSLLQ